MRTWMIAWVLTMILPLSAGAVIPLTPEIVSEYAGSVNAILLDDRGDPHIVHYYPVAGADRGIWETWREGGEWYTEEVTKTLTGYLWEFAAGTDDGIFYVAAPVSGGLAVWQRSAGERWRSTIAAMGDLGDYRYPVFYRSGNQNLSLACLDREGNILRWPTVEGKWSIPEWIGGPFPQARSLAVAASGSWEYYAMLIGHAWTALQILAVGPGGQAILPIALGYMTDPAIVGGVPVRCVYNHRAADTSPLVWSVTLDEGAVLRYEVIADCDWCGYAPSIAADATGWPYVIHFDFNDRVYLLTHMRYGEWETQIAYDRGLDGPNVLSSSLLIDDRSRLQGSMVDPGHRLIYVQEIGEPTVIDEQEPIRYWKTGYYGVDGRWIEEPDCGIVFERLPDGTVRKRIGVK